MKKSVALLILFFTFSISAKVYAQVQVYFIKGTVTLQNGDKKTGLIRNDETSTMNYRIYFKANESEQPVAMDTTVVERVEMENGSVYQLVQFEPEKRMTSTGAAKLGSMRVLGFLLEEGWTSLFRVQFRSDRYYIFKTPEKNYLLKDDKIELQSVSLNFYKNLLALATQDAPAMRKELKLLRFNDKSLIQFTTLYNKEHQSDGKVYKSKDKAQHFAIAFYNRSLSKTDKRNFFQAMYRVYFPSISKGTSINIGFNFFTFQGTETSLRYITLPYYQSGYVVDVTNTKGQLYTVPIQFQQNILNGPVRPYLFGGINWSHIKETDPDGKDLYAHGYGYSYGVHYLYGGGIEWSAFKGLLVKTEWRFERIGNPFYAGIGYCIGLDRKSKLGSR